VAIVEGERRLTPYLVVVRLHYVEKAGRTVRLISGGPYLHSSLIVAACAALLLRSTRARCFHVLTSKAGGHCSSYR
jgi:hypothetical protein